MENSAVQRSFSRPNSNAQTAVRAAVLLHPEAKDRLSDVRKIEIVTHESGSASSTRKKAL